MSFKDLLKRLEDRLVTHLGNNEEIEVNVITIDGIEYTEVMRLPLDGNIYVYLSDLDNPDNFFIHKLIEEDGKTYIIGLDSKEEFDRALLHFNKTLLDN